MSLAEQLDKEFRARSTTYPAGSPDRTSLDADLARISTWRLFVTSHVARGTWHGTRHVARAARRSRFSRRTLRTTAIPEMIVPRIAAPVRMPTRTSNVVEFIHTRMRRP